MSTWSVACALVAAASIAPAQAEAGSFSVIGAVPGGPLIGAVKGTTLYGVIPTGGANGAGELFSLTAAGKVTDLHDFVAGPDGQAPNGRLAVDSKGDLFGTAQGGGQYGGGTLWEYSAAGAFSIPHAFGNNGDGTEPLQGPTIDAAGNVYGNTAGGAVATNGNTFMLTSGGTYTVLHDFLSGTDGHCPFSGVAVGKSGFVYGETVGNGFGGNPGGSVFMVSNSTLKLKTLHVFTGGTDGEYPNQAPTLGRGGILYGTTYIQGGNGFAGVLWQVAPGDKFSVLHSFNSVAEGYQPNSPLVLARTGNLYGTALYSGPAGNGTVYQITPAGALTVLHGFANGTDGANPTGNLALDSKGNIYGGTASGQVFKITP